MASEWKVKQETDFPPTARIAEKDGILELSNFKEEVLTPIDFKSILQSLSSIDSSDLKTASESLEEPEDRPRKKCRRIEGVSSLLSHLQIGSRPIWKLKLVGNHSNLLLWEGKEDGEPFFSLIPSTIKELDLSNCNLSNQAIINVCQSMESNNSISSLILLGNPGLNENEDQGVGRAISRMMGKNKTLETLSIIPERGQLGVSTTVEIAFSLGKNNSLKVLHMAWDDDNDSDRAQTFHQLTKSSALTFGLQTNTTLQEVTFGGLPRNDSMGNRRWEDVLQKNETLRSICGDYLKPMVPQSLIHYLDLNAMNARQLMRENDRSDYSDRWMDTLIRAAQEPNTIGVHALFYLLRHDPGLWC